MPTFEYQATSADGQPVSGMVFGASLDQAVQDLARRGIQISSIGIASNPNDPLAGRGPAASAAPREGGQSEYVYDSPPVEPEERRDAITTERHYVATSVVGPLVGKVALSHLLFFFRQLSTMLQAGVPIVQCLDTLARQAKDFRLAKVVREMREHVQAGRPISAGMQRYPEVFSPLMMSLVRAGEESGNLDQLLGQVADYLEREIELRNLVRRVTIYPKILLVFSVLIVLGTNAIIASLGKEGGLSSPLTTPSTWIWLGPLVIGIFLFLRVGLANPRVKYNWDLFILCIPFMGGTIRQLTMAKFGRAFGALYKGGIAPPRAIQLAADACGNEYLRARMYPAVEKLKSGAGITETLRETHAFSPIVLDMTQTGETTGNLDHMLTKLAEFYEDEGKTRSEQMGWIFGAVVLLGVSVYIGYIVVSFWTSFGAERTKMIE